MKILLLLLPLSLAVVLTSAQYSFDEDDNIYRGKFIGSINSYHHQVNGDVYAVNSHTLLIKNFVYDGNGIDTFFWAGGSSRPSHQGFIVPNEYGRTNVLKRYLNKEIAITLPDRKRINNIKWFSVYDLTQHSVYGDVYIPEDFDPPGPQILSDIYGKSNEVRVDNIIVMDAKTLKLSRFNYDGQGGNVYFWVGIGPQPSSKGHQVPDEKGYLSPLRRYVDEDIYLVLPGDLTIFNIRWFSIFEKDNNRDLGHLVINGENLNVPPSLSEIIPIETSMPNCEMLHSNLMIAWTTFAPSITIQLSGLIEEDEYIGFGISGNQGTSEMIGSDAAICYINGYSGYVDDYNITAKSTCNNVVGVKKGVCRDDQVGGSFNNQIQKHTRENGVTTITYRRTLLPTSDAGDLELKGDSDTSIIWAIGKLARKGRYFEPSFHHTYPKNHVTINFGRKKEKNNCVSFMKKAKDPMNILKKIKPWGPFKIFDPKVRTFDARVGPSGGKRGYEGITGLPSSGLSWYINGHIVPELYLRRGLTYAFRVEGGNDPYSSGYYHPMIISSDPIGGFERLSDEQKRDIRIYGGVQYTRRGVPRTTASGRLCLWKHRENADRRLDDNFNTFVRFRNSLKLECEQGEAAVLEVTPNVTWPDVVYYNSYTTPYMGYKIHIVDNFNQRYLLNGSNKIYSNIYVIFTIFVSIVFSKVI